MTTTIRATSCSPSVLERERGSVTAFTLILIVASLAFAGLVLDAGLAVATKVDTVSSAQACARAGARELDVEALRTRGVVQLDRGTARTTAQDWLRRSGHTGTVTVGADTVTVTITTAHRTQLLNLLGIDSIPVSATETAIAVQP